MKKSGRRFFNQGRIERGTLEMTRVRQRRSRFRGALPNAASRPCRSGRAPIRSGRSCKPLECFRARRGLCTSSKRLRVRWQTIPRQKRRRRPCRKSNPIKYQRRAVSVRSATGPHRKTPEIGGNADRTNRSRHRDGKKGADEDKRKSDGNKTAADSIRKHQKKERDRGSQRAVAPKSGVVHPE